jgi:hypothetical protein
MRTIPERTGSRLHPRRLPHHMNAFEAVQWQPIGALGAIDGLEAAKGKSRAPNPIGRPVRSSRYAQPKESLPALCSRHKRFAAVTLHAYEDVFERTLAGVGNRENGRAEVLSPRIKCCLTLRDPYPAGMWVHCAFASRNHRRSMYKLTFAARRGSRLWREPSTITELLICTSERGHPSDALRASPARRYWQMPSSAAAL